MRNHGFILTRKGWILSPAYDINPNDEGTGLSLNISENDNSLSFDLCLSVSGFFRWDLKEAKSYIQNVSKEIQAWEVMANEFKISRNEQSFMARAFKSHF